MRFTSKTRSHCLSPLPRLDPFHADISSYRYFAYPINRRTRAQACAYECYSLRKSLSNAESSRLSGPIIYRFVTYVVRETCFFCHEILPRSSPPPPIMEILKYVTSLLIPPVKFLSFCYEGRLSERCRKRDSEARQVSRGPEGIDHCSLLAFHPHPLEIYSSPEAVCPEIIELSPSSQYSPDH